MEFDVVVLGSGAAGLTTAVVAAREGLRVALVEKTALVGGTTAISGGAVWIPCTEVMRGAGQEDNSADAERYLRATLGEHFDAHKVAAYLDNGPAMLLYMAATCDVHFGPTPVPDYEIGVDGWKSGRSLLPRPFDGRKLGHHLRKVRGPLACWALMDQLQVDMEDVAHLQRAYRSLSSFLYAVRLLSRFCIDKLRYGRGSRLLMGQALVGSLLRSALDGGVQLFENAEVRNLEIQDGAVHGVELVRDGKATTIAARRAVVLATGGFGANQAMRARYIPLADAGCSIQPEGCQGDGIRLGTQAGGVLAEGNAANAIWTPVSIMSGDDGNPYPYPHLTPDRHMPGSLIVDAGGRRFVNEATDYQHFGNAMLHNGITTAYLIADSAHRCKYGMGHSRPSPYPIKKYLENGYLFEAATIALLASKLGINPQALEHTVTSFNRFADAGRDPEFNRGGDAYSALMGDPSHLPNTSVGALRVPPFYAIRLHPGDLSTLIGLETNANAQVLRQDGSPIKGLYAVGLDANSMMRGKYPGGGSSIGPAMTFGYIAARHIGNPGNAR